MKRLKRYLLPVFHLFFPVVYLYRTYKYNLYTEEKRRPSNLIRSLVTTTQKLTRNRKTILFYPEIPYASGYVISQLLFFLGYGVANKPEHKFDFVIKWKDATFSRRDDILSGLAAQNISIINIKCEDISKSYIDEVFHCVFGYSATVDPLTYTGKCVVKSNLNAQGPGKIIPCPIDTIESDVVYNKLIDNEVEDGIVLYLRVPVFKHVIPFVFSKNNLVKHRFGGGNKAVSVQLAQTHDVLSEDEIRKTLYFCQKIGLDYGELDVLRDKNDKQLYIVDANNTPYSNMLKSDPLKLPANKRLLSPNDRLIALQKLAQSFKDMLELPHES